MKFCYKVHSDNTSMDCGYDSKLEVTKDLPGHLGSSYRIKQDN